MTKWKAAFSRDKPPSDKSDFVFAFKDSKGERMEVSGRMNAADAHNFIREIIISMKKSEVA